TTAVTIVLVMGVFLTLNFTRSQIPVSGKTGVQFDFRYGWPLTLLSVFDNNSGWDWSVTGIVVDLIVLVVSVSLVFGLSRLIHERVIGRVQISLLTMFVAFVSSCLVLGGIVALWDDWPFRREEWIFRAILILMALLVVIL